MGLRRREDQGVRPEAGHAVEINIDTAERSLHLIDPGKSQTRERNVVRRAEHDDAS